MKSRVDDLIGCRSLPCHPATPSDEVLSGQFCLKRMKQIGAQPRPSLHGPTAKNVGQLVLDDDDDADDDDDEN